MNKSYYFLWQSSDSKVIGIKNGGSQAKIDKDGFVDKTNYEKYSEFFLDRSPSVWSKIDKIPDFEITLECVRLEKHAVFTDFLSYYPTAFRAEFLMNDKAISLLEHHNLPIYKKYSAKVFYSPSEFKLYHLVYFPTLAYEIIDFDKTIFYRGSELIGKEYLKIRTPDELQEVKLKFSLDIEKLALTKEFDSGLDIFTTKLLPDFIISSRLREAIVQEKLTGVNLIAASGPRHTNVVAE